VSFNVIKIIIIIIIKIKKMLQGQFARLVHTGEHKVRACSIFWYTRGSVFKFVQLPRDLSSKYLTGLMLWSILQGGNSAPMKSLVHTEELCFKSGALDQNPAAKPLVCISLKLGGIEKSRKCFVLCAC